MTSKFTIQAVREAGSDLLSLITYMSLCHWAIDEQIDAVGLWFRTNAPNYADAAEIVRGPAFAGWLATNQLEIMGCMIRRIGGLT